MPLLSFNVASLASITGIEDAGHRKLATQWARYSSAQNSFNTDTILGDVFVSKVCFFVSGMRITTFNVKVQGKW